MCFTSALISLVGGLSFNIKAGVISVPFKPQIVTDHSCGSSQDTPRIHQPGVSQSRVEMTWLSSSYIYIYTYIYMYVYYILHVFTCIYIYMYIYTILYIVVFFSNYAGRAPDDQDVFFSYGFSSLNPSP